MKEWIKSLCPEIADWQAEMIAEAAEWRIAAERLAITETIKEEMTDELEDEAYHLCMELIAKILKRGQA